MYVRRYAESGRADLSFKPVTGAAHSVRREAGSPLGQHAGLLPTRSLFAWATGMWPCFPAGEGGPPRGHHREATGTGEPCLDNR